MRRNKKKKDPNQFGGNSFLVGEEISCPCCTTCFKMLTMQGDDTGMCVFGGPFKGYKKVD